MFASDYKKMDKAAFFNGHLNVYIRDHDRCVTGYGAHDRVVAFLPSGNKLECRIDHKWHLGMPTAEQVLIVARKDQGIGGRWALASSETNGETSQFTFTRKG